MRKYIISRDDRLSRAMPDLARCADGSLVCVFRESALYGRRDESLDHLPGEPFSQISQIRSLNAGGSWGDMATPSIVSTT